MTRCKQVEALLQQAGLAAVAKHAELREHARSCEHCHEQIAEYRLDQMLAALGKENLPDEQPSAELIEKSLRATNTILPLRKRLPVPMRQAVAAGFAVVFLGSLGITSHYWRDIAPEFTPLAPAEPQIAMPAPASTSATPPRREIAKKTVDDAQNIEWTAQPNAKPRQALPLSGAPAMTPPVPDRDGLIAAEPVIAEPVIEEELEFDSPQAVADAMLDRQLRNYPAPATNQTDNLSDNMPATAEEMVSPKNEQAIDDSAVLLRVEVTGARSNVDKLTRQQKDLLKEMNSQREHDHDHDGVDLNRVVVTGSRLSAIDIEGAQPADIKLAGAEEFKRIDMEPAGDEIAQTAELAANEETVKTDEFLANSDLVDGLGSIMEPAPPAAAPAPAKVDKNKSRLLQTSYDKSKASAESVLTPGKIAGLSGRLDQSQPASTENSFLSQYSRLDGLNFQPTNGYWANTYVPGDAEIRLLAHRLQALSKEDKALPDRVVTTADYQLDAPEETALNLHLRSDHNALQTPQRVRLQVGIQAIEQRLGQRPAMNLAVVVDVPTDSEDAIRIQVRALLDALLKAQRPGDHIHLLHNKPGQALLLSADDFHYGPLQLALRQLLNPSRESLGQTRHPAQLLNTLRTASELIRAHNDPSQPIGSSAIVLITADELRLLDGLTHLAHANARDGISLNMLPLGPRPQPAAVEKLVLAGLGQRKTLNRAAEAESLIEDLLHGASRAVARAVRLSIRLTPGVQLVDVIGSKPLAEPAAQQVRDIEQSMDQRLSRNLGINVDRGADEQGIQIVIPSFLAGDTHTILLDLVATQAGMLAEVSMRYKDLVFLNNASAHEQISLPRGDHTLGPREHLVLKDLLARRFSEATRGAADALGVSGTQGHELARNALAMAIDLYRSALSEIPTLRNDADIQNDLRTLEDYIQQLIRAPSAQATHQLSASLRLAAWRKTHTAALEESP